MIGEGIGIWRSRKMVEGVKKWRGNNRGKEVGSR